MLKLLLWIWSSVRPFIYIYRHPLSNLLPFRLKGNVELQGITSPASAGCIPSQTAVVPSERGLWELSVCHSKQLDSTMNAKAAWPTRASSACSWRSVRSQTVAYKRAGSEARAGCEEPQLRLSVQAMTHCRPTANFVKSRQSFFFIKHHITSLSYNPFQYI